LGNVFPAITWIRHSLQQSVWEVMTEPSAEASLPTPITVQLWGTSSAAERNPDNRMAAAIQARRLAQILSLEPVDFIVFPPCSAE
jgi:hypothetical protein